MIWSATTYAMIPFILSAVLLALLAFQVVYRRNRAVESRAVAALIMLASAEWTLGYAFELRASELASKMFWAKVQYVGIVIVPTAWYVYTLQYTGRAKWMTRRTVSLLALLPLLTLLLAFTNEAHGLIWQDIVLEKHGPLLTFSHSFGVWLWVYVAYAYILLLMGAVCLIELVVRSHQLYRRQTNALLLSAVAPWVGSALDISGALAIDLAPLAFSITGLALGWSLFRLRLGDIVPVARELVIDGISDGIIVLDAHDRVLDFNPVAKQLIGTTLKGAIGKPVAQLWPAWQAQIERIRDEPQAAREVVLADSAARRTYDVRISPLVDWRSRLVSRVVVLRDITERKNVEEQLLHDALHDRLTGLPNRALFMDRLQIAFARGQRHEDFRFAVLFLDLDRFKVVNDSLGHLVGDQLLIAVSERLQACLRQVDTVARMGGDEFVIILENIHGIADATRVARRIEAELRRSFQLAGHEVFSSASIGVVISAPHYYSKQPADLLRDADIALYRAKEMGRSRYAVFDREMHAQAMAVLRVETELRRAIERAEFELFYQPIVLLSTGQIAGFEALIRWQHPARGLIAPAEFIPLAEETNLILPIGHWVLREACKQMAAWQTRFATDPPLAVSVNLSGKQLRDPHLVQQIRSVLDETGLDPQSLVLEITESAIIQDAETAIAILARLKAMGVQLHMDDFGAGYSSLSVLHKFPLDTMKIDRSFINRMAADSNNREIVRTIVNLGHHLQMGVIAEGIETAGELDQLKALDCEYGQGFFISRPMPGEAVLAFLNAELQLAQPSALPPVPGESWLQV